MLISVQMEGGERLERGLADAMGKLQSLEPVMRTIADAQLASTQQNFRDESFGGERWPRLAESTARAFITGTPGKRAPHRKKSGTGFTKGSGKRRGYDNMLRPKGTHLYQKLHQSNTNVEARVSVATPWAWVHNLGPPLAHFTMPRRTFMGITPHDNVTHLLAVERFVEQEVFRGLR